jgi:hypothetical protein
MSTKGHYLGVFLSNKSSAKWRAWYALSKEEQAAKDAIGLPALATKRTSDTGVADVVNEMTVFVVVRADSHEAAARLFEGHPHMTIYPCDCVDVMPLLGG